MLRNILLPTIFGILAYSFWVSPDFKTVAAGLSLFMFGMLSLEEGFKAFTGGTLELLLRRFTDRQWKSIALGVVSTTIMQSSSLVSLITISFLSAGLIKLAAGIGIIFGANLGTTTGAWLVAGFGLKVKISAYAMPLLTFGVLLIFQNSKKLKGIGHGLAGLGLLFLGIHFMKEGFDAFSETINLSSYAVDGYKGLFLFTAIGAAATVILQSSHATLVLIITALASGQITYENAMALAIGANVGTTITAIIGSLSANIEGKRLAVAHLIFNVTTGLLAIGLISQLIASVDLISEYVGIRSDDYTLKIAVFHTLFNLLGLIIMVPFINRLATSLEQHVHLPKTDVATPRYLSSASMEVPAAATEAVRKELINLYEYAFRLIAHGLSLHRGVIRSEQALTEAASATRRVMDLDVDIYYERYIKNLHGSIVDFIIRLQSTAIDEDTAHQLSELRQASINILEAVKALKHLHKNMSRQLLTCGPNVRKQYDEMRVEIASVMRELESLRQSDGDIILSLDAASLELKQSDHQLNSGLDDLIRQGEVTQTQATSLMNDGNYSRHLAESLIAMGRRLFGARKKALSEAQRQMSLADSELDDLMNKADLARGNALEDWKS
ncbi:MAG: Na/Pi symporter [Halioglobus sp.]